jgi:hypothetical protein
MYRDYETRDRQIVEDLLTETSGSTARPTPVSTARPTSSAAGGICPAEVYFSGDVVAV